MSRKRAKNAEAGAPNGMAACSVSALDPIRTKDITATSEIRSPDINADVGGSLYSLAMTTVPLAVLLRERNESLSVRAPARPGWVMRALARVREWEWARVMTLIVTLAALVQRHGLVVGALVSFVIAASLVSTVLAWVVAGVALLFLEIRRK